MAARHPRGVDFRRLAVVLLATALLPLTTGSCASEPDATEPLGIEPVCIDHDGAERCADVYFPPAGPPRPILLDLHGWGSDPTWQRSRSGFAALAATEGFVAAWPAGLGHAFNAGGFCCEPAVGDDTDDVGYLRSLVAELVTIDGGHDGRVFVTGLSNGCAMAQRFAVEASDLVDAVACFAFYLLVAPPAAGRPVPVMELHALNDPIVAYDGFAPLFPGAEDNIAGWAGYNGCDVATGPVVSRGAALGDAVGGGWESIDSIRRFEGCEADTVLVTLREGGHLPYQSGGLGLDTTRLAWEFLTAERR